MLLWVFPGQEGAAIALAVAGLHGEPSGKPQVVSLHLNDTVPAPQVARDRGVLAWCPWPPLRAFPAFHRGPGVEGTAQVVMPTSCGLGQHQPLLSLLLNFCFSDVNLGEINTTSDKADICMASYGPNGGVGNSEG